MNHTKQNSLKACAYMLGITVEELIDALKRATKEKPIKTLSGHNFEIPDDSENSKV